MPVLQLLQDIQGTWAPATASHAYDTFVITDGYVYKTTGENSYYHLYIKKASDGYAYVYCQIGDPTSDSDGRILYYVGGEDDTFVYEKLYSGSSNATYIAYQKVK